MYLSTYQFYDYMDVRNYTVYISDPLIKYGPNYINFMTICSYQLINYHLRYIFFIQKNLLKFWVLF